MELHKNEQLLHFVNYKEWLDWLSHNYNISKGLWLKFAKKGSGIQSITYEEAREGALIYGWIDGLKNAFDEKFYVLRFTPRRPKGVWSKINTAIAEDLIKSGKMHPAGLKEVENAKADGRWDAAYASSSTITIPEDFQKELDAHPNAFAFFKTLNSANRYAFLYRLHTAKKPETKAAHIQKFITMLEEGKTFHPQPTKK